MSTIDFIIIITDAENHKDKKKKKKRKKVPKMNIHLFDIKIFHVIERLLSVYSPQKSVSVYLINVNPNIYPIQ